MSDTIQEFTFSVDLLKAILWQYNNATNLQSLLYDKDAWYEINQTQFWEDWITDVFDLRTANEFGLSVWSIILGFPLFNNTGPITEGAIFGFDTQTGYNFDNGIFGSSEGQTINFSTEIKRLALRLRYFQLVSAGTVPEVNRMLQYLFEEDYGGAWLIDYKNMTQAYIFNFSVPFEMGYLFNNFDILPRPAGVMNRWIDATVKCWGFSDDNYNFDNGKFGE